jgi:two-component system, chemotaxis family, sensor kinase CheA
VAKKLKKSDILQILNIITKQIISYEPGDVMAVSDLITELEGLCAAVKGTGDAEEVSVKLTALAYEELKGGSETFSAEMSRGLDLLREVMEGEPEGRTSGRIGEWLRDGKPAAALMEKVAAGEAVVAAAGAEGAGENPEQLDKDQLKLFVSDSEERFSRAQELVLMLEGDPGNGEAVKELFRVFHTVKGECGFLKLSTLGTLTHNIENLMDQVRSGKKVITKEIIDVLLGGIDLSAELVSNLKKEDFAAYRGVSVAGYTARLDACIKGGSAVSAGIEAAAAVPAAPVVSEEKAVSGVRRAAENEESVIKVKTGKVNYLVDMIGELLISLGQMKEETEGLPQIRKIARTLQYAGMQLRTESVHTLFGTVRRIIRDTSQKVGKQVETIYEGEDLEIDRTLIESLEEPLMHLIRNSLDHGIEGAQEREEAGKSREGTLRVAAERRGNNIVISVGDDGRGLDRAKILKKAAEKGLVREQDMAEMSDAAVHNLIFVSGFSTNESVNLISGRGVGMDIVKDAVAKAKGHITTESEPGKGTTFSLYFPLSTAIIDGMLTKTGGNIFIIPIASIVESLKVKAGQVHKVAEGVYVLDLRGRMIPVIRLADIFRMEKAGSGEIATIIENAGREQFAVLSDEILAKREVVIKNLGPCFRNLKGISSGTVLSGGTVGLVLDIEQVIALGKEAEAAEEMHVS